mgnify:CR=1 FL=1
MTGMRIGHGYDVHRFAEQAEDAAISIGGVQIPHTHKVLAHSDGDVLIHALCDDMLGALALGDIRKHFPDTAARYSNISSRLLLQQVCALVSQKGWSLGNADMTIVAQEPRMAPHIQAMRAKLAACCQVEQERISVKATTTEKLGFAGRKEGLACHAVVLLQHD